MNLEYDYYTDYLREGLGTTAVFVLAAQICQTQLSDESEVASQADY